MAYTVCVTVNYGFFVFVILYSWFMFTPLLFNVVDQLFVFSFTFHALIVSISVENALPSIPEECSCCSFGGFCNVPVV